MATLDWIGKRAVLNHHREVPYHVLKCDKAASVGAPGSGNLLVQGDNLLALKALLPYYGGQVKCIYIDPPYNTGTENWVYNDAVNSPEMKAWLGKVVGKEAEDLSRHDKWLCMMYPRLSLLKEFLKDDGAIFVSIADQEVHNLRQLMDEIFGPRNFVAAIIWQKVYSPKNSAKHFSEDHDYILVYAKDAQHWRPSLMKRNAKQLAAYVNLDDDPRGPWKIGDLAARNYYSEGTYPITCPSGRIIEKPPNGNYWRVKKSKFEKMDAEKRIWWGQDGNSIPQIKRFLTDVKKGVVPQTLWFYNKVGHTQEAKKELITMCDFKEAKSVFVTPKPTRLLKRILKLASDEDSIILDSFAGSGSTGQAVLDLNARDKGNRRFILVEMEEDVAEKVTKSRLERAITGKGWKGTEKEILFEASITLKNLKNGESLIAQADKVTEKNAGKFDKIVRSLKNGVLQIIGTRKRNGDKPGFGGGVRYCTLGAPLTDESGSIHGDIKFADLSAHVYFSETGEPLPKRPDGSSPLIGVHKGVAFYLLFNGVMGDNTRTGGNVLTLDLLRSLPAHDGPRIIYGEECRVGPQRLKSAKATFKQLPYQIKVR